jgi:hypothetical protein
MKPVFTKTFIHFFMGFLAILAVAFGVMLTASSHLNTSSVDAVAHP